MRNATPKSESIDKGRKVRIQKLSELNKESLEKALVLFNQLNTSGIHAHRIEENKIIGLKNEDITWALHVINPVYVEENNKIPNAKYMEAYEEVLDENGKLKKVKIILYGDVKNNPVFLFSNFSDKSERTFMAGPKLDEAIAEIKETLSNVTPEAKKKIKNLKNPIRWENITLLFNTDSVKIKQDSTLLGEYTLKELGVPKLRKNQSNGVYSFFTRLFFKEHYIHSDILSVKDKNNQKLKSNLSKILREAFNTNKDPISIDQKTGKYIPLFKVGVGNDYRINNYHSGRRLYDKDGAEIYDFTEHNLE